MATNFTAEEPFCQSPSSTSWGLEGRETFVPTRVDHLPPSESRLFEEPRIEPGSDDGADG